jgi:hypothetical protein
VSAPVRISVSQPPSVNQNTAIAMFERENVTKTLIEYMTTSFETWPPV